jgi:hypothetical protein
MIPAIIGNTPGRLSIDLASSPTRIASSAKCSSRQKASIRIKPLDNCPIAYDEGAIMEATNTAELTMDEFVEYLETRSPRNTTATPAVAQDADAIFDR